MWRPESEPCRSPLNLALQSSSKVTINQRAVRDSGFIQLDQLINSRPVLTVTNACS